MIHICLKDKTHIVNITTCFVQRGSYDDSREYLQEAGDRPTHFRDSEKSGRKILSDLFRFAEEKNTFLYNFAGGCHKNCFTLAVVGPTETLPTLSSCSQERSPDFPTSFQGSHLVYLRQGKSLGYTLTLQFIHVTKITIFVIT